MNNTDLVKARNRANKARNIEITRKIRTETSCTDCEKHYPYYVMDFDHVSGEKTRDVAHLAQRGVSVETLMAEIAKCEVVCSNCHRQRTWSRRQALEALK